MNTQLTQTSVTLPKFDYSKLERDALDALVDCETELETVLKRTHEEIGHILIRAKKIIPYGGYEIWHRSQGITDSMASRCVQAAKGTLPKSPILKLLPEKHNYTSHLNLPKNHDRTQQEIEADAFEATTKVMIYNRNHGVPVNTTWRPDGVTIGHDRKGNFVPVPDECVRETIYLLTAYADENGL
jgi:hypothetical protein